MLIGGGFSREGMKGIALAGAYQVLEETGINSNTSETSIGIKNKNT